MKPAKQEAPRENTEGIGDFTCPIARLKETNEALSNPPTTPWYWIGPELADMAALLAQQLPGRTLVIAPPTLLDENNPGSWPNVFRDFQVRQSDRHSEHLSPLER